MHKKNITNITINQTERGNMDIKITMNCDNAAFEESPQIEIAEILKQLRLSIKENGIVEKSILDTNGNVIGKLEVIV